MKRTLALILCIAMVLSFGLVAFADVETSEPKTSDPASTNPVSSEPASSEPASSDPQSSEPQSSDPQSSEVVGPFVDIAGCGFEDEILWCYENGYMIGYKDGTFRPGQNISRAQIALVFYRLSRGAVHPESSEPIGYTDEADITATYFAAVKWAKETGVMIGYTDNSFRPNQAITREEFATVFYRFVGGHLISYAKNPGIILDRYSDGTDVKAPFVQGMVWAIQSGNIEGFADGALRPQANLTRGQMAAIICREYTRIIPTDFSTTDPAVSDPSVSQPAASDPVSTDVPLEQFRPSFADED